MPFYGLHIPTKGGGGSGGGTAAQSGAVNTNSAAAGTTSNTSPWFASESATSPFVFSSKANALRELKQHKDARLREFDNQDDAVYYVQTGCEVVQTKYDDVKTSTAAVEKAAFRAPTKQELVEFRKAIEKNKYERVKTIIWDNPRYLVSCGDTPTMLKEGYRYNAMHVCSISKRPEIADLILKTITNTKFTGLLTGKQTDERKELSGILLDYFLNMPEKGRMETPLHLAAKTGCVEMVEVLISYPECKQTPNSDGYLPKDIICTRVFKDWDIIRKIQALLEERFFVPVYRSIDNSIPPQIGQPFPINNPPNLNCDPMSPEVKIQALAGPMDKEQATKFCRRWKTPPRTGNSSPALLSSSPYVSPVKSRFDACSTPVSRSQTPNSSIISATPNLQRRILFHSNSTNDSSSMADQQNGNHKSEEQQSSTTNIAAEEKGDGDVETNNNGKEEELKKMQKFEDWKKFSTLWPSTPLMKAKRQAFFTYREQHAPSPIVFDNFDTSYSVEHNSPAFKERHIKNTDTEKGLELIGRELAKEQNVEWREYWDFLNDFLDIASTSGLQKLEAYFAQRLKDAETPPPESSLSVNAVTTNTMVTMDNVCSALEKLGLAKDGGSQATLERNGLTKERNLISSGNANAAPQTTTPYTCVEKSLQVFAKRITKSIMLNMENVVSVNDMLLSELKRLKALISSFKEDDRFINVNFSRVHSRIGNLVAFYLGNSQDTILVAKEKLVNILQNLLSTPSERRDHMECVCLKICAKLQSNESQILPENLKTEEICAKTWQMEQSCDCQWDPNLSRKTSRRNRMEARYKNFQKAQEDKENLYAQQGNANNADDKPQPLTLGENTNKEDYSDDEEEVYWSDFGSDSDTTDIWYTPIQSPTRPVEDEADAGYKLFIYGDEPTKRDLHVLNAIFHVDINKSDYPLICAWKAALLRIPSAEMDYFPSPSVVRKSQLCIKPQTHSPFSYALQPQALKQQLSATSSLSSTNTTTSSNNQTTTPQQQHTIGRRALFNSPSRAANKPLSKLRSLFTTNYRERFDNNRPIFSASPASSPASNFNDVKDISSNISLLNISASE